MNNSTINIVENFVFEIINEKIQSFVVAMNRYTVSALIGEGSFGRVYKAVRKEDAQVVAIKVISKVRKLYTINITVY